MKQKGKAEVKRMKEAASAAVKKYTSRQKARVDAGGVTADEQAAAVEGPRHKQRTLEGYPRYEPENAGNDDE